METNINKSQYQWLYVIVSVAFAFVICGSFMFVKYRRNQTTNNEVDSIIKITSTTVQAMGKSDIIGKEKAHTTVFKEPMPSVPSTKAQQTLSSNEEYETKGPINSNDNTIIESNNEDTSSSDSTSQIIAQEKIEDIQTETSIAG
ncbi:MAG: hypothetical protein EOM05_04450 [Clostridia bacterium]|nr:hypothetical protein [Clostridia bacterium]